MSTSRDALSRPRVAYIGRVLPKLSETFVLNEIFAVRAAGVDVIAASVFRPSRREEELLSFTEPVLVAYGIKAWCSAVAELSARPIRCAATVANVVRDMVTGRDASLYERAKLPLHAISALGLARLLRARHVDHIHAHMANVSATVAMYAAKQLGIGFSLTGHADDLFVNRSFLPDKLQRAKFVACISYWHRRFYRHFADLPDERLPLIRCGVDVRPNTRRQDPAAGPLRVLSVGRLVPKKGMDTLIRAIGQIAPARDVRCQIVGDGPQRKHLAALIQSSGLEHRIELLGARSHADVLEQIHNCDVFVLACQRDSRTTDQDGIPLSLMEAMAASKCVITSALDPITELVIDGTTGICVRERDADHLAAAIRRVQEDVDLRRTLGEAGRRHVEKEFDRVVNAQRLADRFHAASHAHNS